MAAAVIAAVPVGAVPLAPHVATVASILNVLNVRCFDLQRTNNWKSLSRSDNAGKRGYARQSYNGELIHLFHLTPQRETLLMVPAEVEIDHADDDIVIGASFISGPHPF